jgi:hypothetical protein
MLETESPFDGRLRAFFGEIKTQGVPQPLVGFRPARVRSRRPMLNLFAAAAGVGVIAAGVAVFAVELGGHHGGGSPIAGGQSAPTPNPHSTPPTLPAFPPGAYQAVNLVVLIPKTYGSGTETLPTVIVRPNARIGIDYGCISSQSTTATSIHIAGAGLPLTSPETTGNGQVFMTLSGVSLSRCAGPSGASGEALVASIAGGPITLSFSAPPSVRWVLLVYEFSASVTPVFHPTLTPSGSSPTATALPEGVAPPGATVLLPLTHGTGPAKLPTFMWSPNDMLYVSYGCGAGVAGDTVTFAGDNSTFDGDFSTGTCSGAVALVAGSGLEGGAGGPVSLTVKAAPTLQWAIFIYEAPPGLLGPAP